MTTPQTPRIHLRRVVTRRHAYRADTISLCAEHERDDHPTTRRIFGPLGPVEHGRHSGYCAACDREAMDAIVTYSRQPDRYEQFFGVSRAEAEQIVRDIHGDD